MSRLMSSNFLLLAQYKLNKRQEQELIVAILFQALLLLTEVKLREDVKATYGLEKELKS